MRSVRLLSFLLLTLALLPSATVQAQGNGDTDTAAITTEDTTQTDATKNNIHQIRIGFDIGRILFNNLFPSRQGYEIQVDYNWKNNLYWAAEGGWGRGQTDYPFLRYKTRGAFIRLGIEQSLLGSLGPKDFDNAFIGVRYGTSFGKIGDAFFTVPSPFGGQSEGFAPGQNYWVHWGEIVGGLTVELWRHVYAGWTVRGKFLLNPGTFKEIAPNYIPGFGKGDKKTTFDFNFYISYGLRWQRGMSPTHSN